MPNPILVAYASSGPPISISQFIFIFIITLTIIFYQKYYTNTFTTRDVLETWQIILLALFITILITLLIVSFRKNR